MSTNNILVHSDHAPARLVPIQQSVVRVGFGNSFDVALPSTAPRTELIATLRKNPDGGWRVYNRCNDNLWIGKQPLAPSDQALWKPGQSLVIEESITLQLASGTPDPVNSKPQPDPDAVAAGRRNAAIDVADEAESNEPAGQDPPKKSNVGPIVVVAMCGLLLAMMALGKTTGSTGDSTAAPGFSRVLKFTDQTDDEDAKYLTAKLRIAQASLVRGDLQSAEQRFSELRQYLSAHRTRYESEQAELELETIRYVEYQLDRLR